MRHQPAKAGEKNKIPFNKNLSFARTVYVRRAVIFFGCVGTIGILKFATSKFPGPSGNPFFSAASRSNMIPLNKDLAHGVNTFGTTLFSKLEDVSFSGRGLLLQSWFLTCILRPLHHR